MEAPVSLARRFRKKPVEIAAVQLEWSTWSEMCEHAGVGDLADGKPTGGWAVPGREAETFNGTQRTAEYVMALAIPTLEGLMIAVEHDWVIRGVAGELYPCKPDIFEQTYEDAATPALEPVRVFGDFISQKTFVFFDGDDMPVATDDVVLFSRRP